MIQYLHVNNYFICNRTRFYNSVCRKWTGKRPCDSNGLLDYHNARWYSGVNVMNKYRLEFHTPHGIFFVAPLIIPEEELNDHIAHNLSTIAVQVEDGEGNLVYIPTNSQFIIKVIEIKTLEEGLAELEDLDNTNESFLEGRF